MTDCIRRTLPVLVLFRKKSQRPSVNGDVLRGGQKVEHQKANCQKQHIGRFRIQSALNHPGKQYKHETDRQLQRNNPGLPPAHFRRVPTDDATQQAKHGVNYRSPQHFQRVGLTAYYKECLLTVGHMLLLEDNRNRARNTNWYSLQNETRKRPLPEECTILTAGAGP